MPSPTNENINFPKSIDVFPTVYEEGSDQPTNRTRLWAEYNNKIRNFIGIIEPCLTSSSASGDSTILGISSPQLVKEIVFADLRTALWETVNSSSVVYDPPSNMIPFEIVLTSENIYDTTNRYTLHLVIQGTNTELDSFIAGYDLFAMKPHVSVTWNPGSTSGEITEALKYMFSYYVMHSSDHFIIRGSLLDTTGTAATGTGLPDPQRHFKWSDLKDLSISIHANIRSGDS